ncbi:MAG: protein-L-isoaspartate O-methyltransferase [Flavobacteriales bacterium]|nr:protein-L-isoaspartate O-methyltransferase [Flavobacteriales bacterium]|tara:strand:+ start:281 stop:928 length:648 start_codon:yes stop_codon:yes gene_type:complete
MNDTFRHKGLRKILVDEIRSKGISDINVLNAISHVPRHLFMDNAFVQFAYQDKAFPIGCDQTISQPYTVAFQTQLLRVENHDKVLEVGTGSGYQSAVLKHLKADVYTIERQKDLFQKTQSFLPSIGYKCRFFYGDGYVGLSQFAPFDKILITCGAPEIPSLLLSQLKHGGRMVAPIGSGKVQIMKMIDKDMNGEVTISDHGNFSFVPMLSDKSSS